MLPCLSYFRDGQNSLVSFSVIVRILRVNNDVVKRHYTQNSENPDGDAPVGRSATNVRRLDRSDDDSDPETDAENALFVYVGLRFLDQVGANDHILYV
jgi:hypothetical protein